MYHNEKFYKCYSPNLKDWIDKNGIPHLASGINTESGKRYWVYLKGRMLQILLDEYKEGKNKK